MGLEGCLDAPTEDKPCVRVGVRKIILNGKGLISRQFWTPMENVKLGAKISIKENDGGWTTGWEIVNVYGPILIKEFRIEDE
jgi:hypothetical protein